MRCVTKLRCQIGKELYHLRSVIPHCLMIMNRLIYMWMSPQQGSSLYIHKLFEAYRAKFYSVNPYNQMVFLGTTGMDGLIGLQYFSLVLNDLA